MKLKLDSKSIKFKTWLYFILFAAFLMIVLWFFQVFFLNSFYGVMKDEQTRSVARDIESSYERKSSEKFLEAVESISTTNDMFIYVVSQDGKTMYFRPSGDSTVGNGTTFWFELNFVKAEKMRNVLSSPEASPEERNK